LRIELMAGVSDFTSGHTSAHCLALSFAWRSKMDVEVKALAQSNITQQEIAALVKKAQEALRQVQVQEVMSIQASQFSENTGKEEDKEEGEFGLFILIINLPNPYALNSGLQELAVVLINSDRITKVKMRCAGKIIYQFNPTKSMVKEVIFKAVDSLMMAYKAALRPATEEIDDED